MSALAELAAIRAMDGLHLRATAIAENVANANSVSVRLKSVDFEAALREAARGGLKSLAAFRPMMTTDPVARAGGEVRLDLEMANAAATSMRYAALTDILNRQMQLNRLAARWGQ